MHIPQEFLCNGIAGAFAYDRINAAIGTECRTLSSVFQINPFVDFLRGKNGKTIETPALLILLQCSFVIDAVSMRFC